MLVDPDSAPVCQPLATPTETAPVRRARRPRAWRRTVGAAVAAGVAAGALLALGLGRADAGAALIDARVVATLAGEPEIEIELDVPTIEPDEGIELLPINDGTPVKIADGAVVTPSVTASLQLDPDGRGQARARLDSGSGRFRVAHADRREVEVAAGDVVVRAWAAEFSVWRRDGATEIWAHRGRVEVLWRGEPLMLTVGEHRRFVDGPGVESGRAGDWRSLARARRWQEAAAALDASTAAPARVEELLLAADALRLADRSHEAVPLLRTILERFPRDARAPAAAFSLGRLLLARRAPADAARAFARVRALAPAGPLAEAALGREVDAWAAARDPAQTRARARRGRGRARE